MQGDATVLMHLNAVLKNETTALNQYFLHARMLEHWGVVKLGTHQYDESIDEMNEETGGVERQMPVITPNPTEGLERGELRQRIDKALGQLSYEHRTVLILHEFEELEYKLIAKKMGCSIGTVMSRLFYARRKMASLLAGLKREELQTEK